MLDAILPDHRDLVLRTNPLGEHACSHGAAVLLELAIGAGPGLSGQRDLICVAGCSPFQAVRQGHLIID